jgi:hypothetical protein
MLVLVKNEEGKRGRLGVKLTPDRLACYLTAEPRAISFRFFEASNNSSKAAIVRARGG